MGVPAVRELAAAFARDWREWSTWRRFGVGTVAGAVVELVVAVSANGFEKFERLLAASLVVGVVVGLFVCRVESWRGRGDRDGDENAIGR